MKDLIRAWSLVYRVTVCVSMLSGLNDTVTTAFVVRPISKRCTSTIGRGCHVHLPITVSAVVTSRSPTRVNQHLFDSDGALSFIDNCRADLISTPSSWTSLLISNGVVDILEGIAVGIVWFVAITFGLAFIAANWLIPQAARQLEEQCKTEYPDLWQEYVSKLEPGETIQMRPDVMQDLGNKYQERLMRDFESKKQAQAQANENTVKDTNISSSLDVIDAEITKSPGDENLWKHS